MVIFFKIESDEKITAGSYATCMFVEPVYEKSKEADKTFSIYYSFQVINGLKWNINMTNALIGRVLKRWIV